MLPNGYTRLAGDLPGFQPFSESPLLLFVLTPSNYLEKTLKTNKRSCSRGDKQPLSDHSFAFLLMLQL